MTLALLLALIHDDKAELGRALKAASELGSYAYLESMELVESPGLDAGGYDREGRFQAEVALALRQEGGEILRFKDGVVVQGERGEWKKAPKKKGGPTAPHERLGGLEARLKNLNVADDTERVDGEECVVFAGDLDGGTAKDALGSDADELVEGLKGLKHSGRARFWVDDQYRVRKVEFVVTVEGDGYELTGTRTVRFTGFGDVKVEVPEEARKAKEH